MMKKHMEDKELFIFDGFVGADPENRLPIRIINNRAWHNLFARQLFIRPRPEELETHTPEFTLLSSDDLAAKPEEMGTRTETFIIINFKKKLVLIGSTSYAGEIKKAMFSIIDRKSTRLNSSHANISYAVFCLKKKKRSSSCLRVSFNF